MIRILQISDIHWKDKLTTVDPFKHIREGLVEDVKRGTKQHDISFDYIMICGDIAFSGGNPEYNKAKEFINELLQVTGLEDEDVFIVPGNHDKTWGAPPQEIREFINSHVCEEKDNDEILAGWLQKSLHSATMMFTPYKEYGSFANEYGCAEPLMLRLNEAEVNSSIMYSEHDDKLFWTDEIAEINGYTLQLYGLNSGLYSDKYDYDTTEKRKNGHKMVLPKLAYNAAKMQDGVVNIMMMHHPMAYLHEGDKLKEELDRLYHVQFFGHVHVAKSDNDNNRIHIFSGALQPDEMGTGNEYRPIYNIVELDIKTGTKEDTLEMKLQERYWDGKVFADFRVAQNYSVKLPKYQWKETCMAFVNNLPDGVTKHAVRVKLINNGRAKDIIEKLSPGFYDESIPRYYNIMRYLETVRQKNTWSELWAEME